ncbi:hypothetical protein M9Y10_037528 [Tritrichomonas musculus]|uniref:Right handed beta helix domain-containing protein n=1 Tax=Tritrichomonas musculus TaxID=1915356 RepID=A0ABR2GRM3_9EUKA
MFLVFLFTFCFNSKSSLAGSSFENIKKVDENNKASKFNYHSNQITILEDEEYESVTVAEATGNYVNNDYLTEYKVPYNHFTCYSPGDQGGHSISLAFDGKDNTFWASSIINTDTVKNYLTFNFTSLTNIEAIIFGPAYSTNKKVTPQTRRYDGYPTILKVYTSTNGEPFKLKCVFSGAPKPTDLWHRVQFVFPESIWCDQLKLEFTEVTLDQSFGNDYTAACAELYFVSPAPEFGKIATAQATGNYANNEYVSANKVPKDGFTYYSPGDQNGHPLSYAFDGNSKSFWASSIVTTDTTKGYLTFTFKERINLEAILMMPAYSTNRTVTPNTRRYDGFPKILKVYTAKDDKPFKLKYIFNGEPQQSDIWDWVQFAFKTPIPCDRLKIEFTEVTLDIAFGGGYTAAAGELYFIRPPPPEYGMIGTAQAAGNYANNEYVNANKVPNDGFTYYSPGDQSGHPLSYAFDGNSKSFWASSIVTTDTTKGYLTFTFKLQTCIEAILMMPAYSTNRTVTPNTRRYDGFPTVLNVYTATGDDPFKLMYTFKGQPEPTDVWDRVQFAFSQAIWCDKLKIEFVEVTPDIAFGGDYTAAAGELYLIAQPPEFGTVATAQAAGNYANDQYVNSNRMQTSSFTSYSPGDQSDHPLSYAFDGSTTTFWASSIVTTDTTKGYLTFTFKTQTCIEAILMMPAYSTNRNVTPNTRRYDGFPKILKVYTSANDEPFRLKYIFTGEPQPTDLWDRVQFVFNSPIWCKKLKIEFTEVTLDVFFGNDYTAAAAELYLMPPATLVPTSTPTPVPTRSPFPTLTRSPFPTLTRSPFPTLTRSPSQSPTASASRSPLPTQTPPPLFENAVTAEATGNYANSQYLNSHKVQSNDMTLESSGDKEGHPLSYLIDGSTSTYWASSTVTTDTEKGYIIANFASFTCLEAILMAPAYSTNHSANPKTRRYDGYPKILKVYTSTNNEPFKLKYVFTGEPQPTDLWDRIQFVFNAPIWCDKIKIEFTEVTLDIFFGNDYTAAAGEIYFISASVLVPTSTPTPLPTATEAPPEPIIIEDKNCDSDGRYEKIVDNHEAVMVTIKVSNFTKVTNPKSGGAIHLENSGIQCENIDFKECETSEAGGAIYIDNTYDFKNIINLEGINFIDCSAKYGGAVYVYSSSKKNVVQIKKCLFEGNKATSTETEEKSGGSAIFMTARKGAIIRSVFRNNNGEGGAVKIRNLFNEDNLIMLNNNNDENDDESSLLISDCSFEMLNNNDCYLFYLRGNNGANVELSKCKFTGTLSNGRYYIKGKSASKEEEKEKEGPKLVVKSCTFESVFSRSFNINNDFLSIDLKEQIFSLNEYDENKNKSSSYILIVAALVCAVVAIFAIVGVIVFVVVRRRNPNPIEDNDMSNEIVNALLNSSSSQDNNNSVDLSLI